MKIISIVLILIILISCDYQMDSEEVLDYNSGEVLSKDYCNVPSLRESIYPITFNGKYVADVKWSVSNIQVLTPVYVVYKSGEEIKVYSPQDYVFPREIRFNKNTGDIYIKTDGSILGLWDVQKIIQWNIPDKKIVNQYNY